MEIIREKRETTVIRFRHHRPTVIYCRTCHAPTTHLTVAQAVLLLPFSETGIFRLAESGQIHSQETADGFLLLCGDSLAGLKQE